MAAASAEGASTKQKNKKAKKVAAKAEEPPLEQEKAAASSRGTSGKKKKKQRVKEEEEAESEAPRKKRAKKVKAESSEDVAPAALVKLPSPTEAKVLEAATSLGGTSWTLSQLHNWLLQNGLKAGKKQDLAEQRQRRVLVLPSTTSMAPLHHHPYHLACGRLLWA